MYGLPFLDSASVLRRVHAETTRVEPMHLDVREITDSVYEQGCPLQSLVERAEHGLWKVESKR
jgi:hypothetical protein